MAAIRRPVSGHVLVRSADGRVVAETNGSGALSNGRSTPMTSSSLQSRVVAMTSSSTGNHHDVVDADDRLPSIELFVKAGKDGRRLGGCPMCQRVHMALEIKSSAATAAADATTTSPSVGQADVNGRRASLSSAVLSFVVTPVNMARPPPDFRRLQPSTRRLPVLVHRKYDHHQRRRNPSSSAEDDVEDVEVLTDADEILQYVDTLYPVPSMSYDTAGPAAVACRDVFSRFSYFVKDVSGSPGPLLAELRRIDAHILQSCTGSSRPQQQQQRYFRYLNGSDRPDHLDCIVLPKLQHVRVAARALKDFDVPVDLRGLWGYLAAAYADPAFRRTCPSDQEIVHHWQAKPECHRVPKSKLAFYSPETTPRYSMDVPPGLGLVEL